MSRYLLDVNLLLALLWPRHEGHVAARSWFAKTGLRSWATNTLTQLGALRLLTNPAITQGAVGFAAALDAVSGMVRHEGHEFWPLNTGSVGASLAPIVRGLTGHRQWTDAVLLCQAKERGGVLATFDAGVKVLAGRDLADHVLLLKRQ